MTPADLRAARKQLGLTQTELGDLLGYTRTAVAYWEHGERPVPKWMPLAIDGLHFQRSLTSV